MKKILSLLILSIILCEGFAQRLEVESIAEEIRATNRITVADTIMIVSYRGLSRFMGRKIASYLSSGGDLSLFQNYAVLNTADGTLSINHNFEFRGAEERVKSLVTVGFRAKVSDAFATIFSGDEFTNDMGATFKYTWIGRGIVNFDDNKRQIEKAVQGKIGSQKNRMNEKRASAISKLEMQMEREASEFELGISGRDLEDVTSSAELPALRNSLRKDFYDGLRKKYTKLFADLEAAELDKKDAFNWATTYWWSIGAYIPITPTKYNVTSDFSSNFTEKKLYPFEVTLSYNRLFESNRYGRFFFYLSGGIFQNNSVKTKNVNGVDLNSYKNLGGTDTLNYALLESKKAFVGEYNTFATQLVKLQFVWFPPNVSVGLSLFAEKNFGKYDPLNVKIGIPIRLKGKGEDSFINFELQARASDVGDNLEPEKNFSDKVAYGVSVGLPFSSFIY